VFSVDSQSRVPIYTQIVLQFEKFVLAGILSAGDAMPSVRQLSDTIRANANTVQKAYIELDRRGLTYSVPGKGVYVADGAADILRRDKESELRTIEKSAYECFLAGIPLEAVLEAAKKGYDNQRGDENAR